MLRAMFSGRIEVLSDAEGYVMIDRSGKHFDLILNFLRDGSVALPENNIQALTEILAEAKYYCVTELEGMQYSINRKYLFTERHKNILFFIV